LATSTLEYQLEQPSARRREWQFQGDGEVKAHLRVPSFRSSAQAQNGEERVLIVRRGRRRSSYLLLDERAGTELASVRRDGRRRLLQLDGRDYEWKRLGHKGGFGFVAPDGQPILAARVRAGLFRSSGDIEVDASLPEQEAFRAGLLAAYMLIRRNDDIAASSAAASVAATS
jgi:hypothetical protein